MLAWTLQLLFCAICAELAFGKCPNWCSQHGICTSPHDDAFCICEMGYAGDGCETRLCPKGDDPLTTGQAARTIRLTTGALSGRLGGSFRFKFNGEEIGFPADASLVPSEAMARIVSSLPNIAAATVTRGPVNQETGGAAYTIALESFPTVPWENNLFSHDGNPALTAFSCEYADEAGADLEGASCEVEDVIIDNVREYTECSRHGRCDRVAGTCACETGFKGAACDDISDFEDAHALEAPGPFFTGSVLRLHAARAVGSTHRLLTASSGSTKLLTLSGRGDLFVHSGRLFIAGGGGGDDGSAQAAARGDEGAAGKDVWGNAAMVLEDGDLLLKHGVLRASSLAIGRALRASATQATAADAVLEVLAPHSASGADAILRVRTAAAAAATPAGALEGEALAVLGDGSVRMRGGDVVIGRAGLTQRSGNASFSGSIDAAGPLRVAAGGVAVVAGDLAVHEGTASVTSSSAAAAAVAAFSSSSGAFVGSVMTLETAAIDPATTKSGAATLPSPESAAAMQPYLLRASAGGRPVLDVPASGPISMSGGLSVTAGGITIGSGGLDVSSGGIELDGGLRLRSGALQLESSEGLTVATGGVTAVSTDPAAPAVTAVASAPGFGGTLLRLAAEAVANGTENAFHFIEGVTGGAATAGAVQQTRFAVRGDGHVFASGGLTADGRIAAKSGIQCGGGVVFSRVSVPAGDVIQLPAATSAYVEILDEGNAAKNRVTLTGGVRAAGAFESEAGQLLIVRNSDAQPTTGELVIPAGYTVIFVYDGSAWRDLRALEAASAALHNVTALTAAADLDIGDFTLRARHLAAAGNSPGRVAIYGGGGVLTAHDGLRWEPATSTLGAARFIAGEMGSDLDFKGFAARNLALVNLTIEGLPALRTERIFLGSAAATAEAAFSSSATSGKLLLAAFGPRGELVGAAGGAHLDSGGVLEVSAIRGHKVLGDVDMTNHVLRNAQLEGVRSLMGLQGLSVGSLTVTSLEDALETGSGSDRSAFLCSTAAGQVKPCQGVERAADGDIRVTGKLIASGLVIGPPKEGAAAAAVSSGAIVVLSASGELTALEGGFALRDGILSNATLGTTKFAGDVDMQGHRLFNVKIDHANLPPPPDIAAFRQLTVSAELRLPLPDATGGGAAAAESAAKAERMLVADEAGRVAIAESARLSINVASASAGRLQVRGAAQLAGGLDLKGTGISNAIRVHTTELEATKVSTDELTAREIVTEAIGGFTLTGAVDAAGNELKTVGKLVLAPHGVIEGLRGLQIGNEGLQVEGSLTAGADASIKGSLTVEGVVMGAGPYVDSSDARLKTSIETVDTSAALQAVRELRGVSYEALAPAKVVARRQLGFVAQELEQVLPELVYRDTNGFRAVAYSRLAPILAAALKELSLSHDALERRVDELETQLSELKQAAGGVQGPASASGDSADAAAVIFSPAIRRDRVENQEGDTLATAAAVGREASATGLNIGSEAEERIQQIAGQRETEQDKRLAALEEQMSIFLQRLGAGVQEPLQWKKAEEQPM